MESQLSLNFGLKMNRKTKQREMASAEDKGSEIPTGGAGLRVQWIVLAVQV